MELKKYALSALDVAALLGLKKKHSQKTVEKLARQGKIKGLKIAGQWVFHPKAVDDMFLLNPKRR